MNSLWNNLGANASPFAAQAAAPAPGGGAAARFQSILQSAGKQSQPSAQLGLSPSSALPSANAANGANTSSASATDSNATISANDFLTLLVTEMQNQDPTADVDPNAYIDQLVQINSLEQLISINQNLATVLGAATSPVAPSNSVSTPGSAATAAPTAASGGGSRPGSTNLAPALAAKARANPSAAAKASLGNHRLSAASAIGTAREATRPGSIRGNLSAPGAAPAANAVGHALDGRARGAGAGHAIRDIPTRALP